MRKMPPNEAAIAPKKQKQQANIEVDRKLVKRLKKMAKMKSACCTSLLLAINRILLIYGNPKMDVSRRENGFRLKNQTFCGSLFGPPDFLSLTLPPFED